MDLFDKILASRGIFDKSSFLNIDYKKTYDPFLMPDMERAVDRLVLAHKNREKITIYGDYDIDGLCATSLMLDALSKFGYENVENFIPNRFDEGYGMSNSAIKKIVENGTKIILTVDCGSRSINEIELCNKLGVDVIVTDHHTALDNQPPAIAVINPKRSDSSYPFCDLAGVGVAFKLIQALQIRLNESFLDNPSINSSTGSEPSGLGLPFGQEKWLLDLVAFGTVCDIVPLVDENRILASFGLKVFQKTKRIGLRALMMVAKVEPEKINSRTLGYILGPRMNAAGRIATAKSALELLITDDKTEAFKKAQYLDDLNIKRRADQDVIFKESSKEAEKMINDHVLVVSGKNWNHGIVGIVASKLLEKYHKPVFVLQEMEKEAKGSARSFGDFDVAKAVDYCRSLIKSGGGHKLAAGITLLVDKIDAFRKKINEFYVNQNLSNQDEYFLPKEDATANLSEVNLELARQIDLLEPFGYGNPKPILKAEDLTVENIKIMGSDGQHVKLRLADKNKVRMDFLSFGAPENHFVQIGQKVSIWYQPEINEWQNICSVEGRILDIR